MKTLITAARLLLLTLPSPLVIPRCVPVALAVPGPTSSEPGNRQQDPSKGESVVKSEVEIYRRARTVIDLTGEELLQTYPDEVRGLEFAEDQQELNSLLQKVGENVEKLFRDLPNTISKEQVRRERLRGDGRVEESITENYNYTACLNSISGWEEARTDSGGEKSRLNSCLICPS